MTIKTISGSTYQYDCFSNRIDMVGDDFPTEKMYSIHFLPVEEIHSLPLLDTFVIELTRECNLRCSYCCYSGAYRHTRTHEPIAMTEKQADETLHFIQSNHKQKPVNICFYGGEPLLNFPVLRYFVEQATTLWNNDVSFFLSTNGVLLKPETVDWLVQHHFGINVSLDGNKFHHDKHRKTASGQGSFSFVYQNLQWIHQNYPVYFQENINLLMTIDNISSVKGIAEAWQADSLLLEKIPAHISNLSPNYAKGVCPVDEQQLTQTLYDLLHFYQSHPENVVLKKFFMERIEDLLERPLFDLPDQNRMSICLPENRKCFIDVHGEIGVCEKMCDSYRIGNIQNGFNFELINKMTQSMAAIRQQHCCRCEIVRLCDTCLLALDLDKDELTLNCHNQRVVTKAYMLIMCELAESGLI